jgi:dienelactone hydrolase
MRTVLVALLFLPTAAQAAGPELVTYGSVDGDALHGFVYRPAGKGPFPAVIWNHGSDPRPGWVEPLGDFYSRNGYVFFVPHRHGHGRSPGAYIGDLEARVRRQAATRAVGDAEVIALHERYNGDVVQAVEWLRSQPYVERARVAMSGLSYGGIQTLLAAEKSIGVCAFVPFGAAAMSWEGNGALRTRLVSAARSAKAPVFLLQASNDFSLGPSQTLGPELARKGGLNRSHVYPAYGSSHEDGHSGFAVKGSDVWGADVLAFLHASCP